MCLCFLQLSAADFIWPLNQSRDDSSIYQTPTHTYTSPYKITSMLTIILFDHKNYNVICLPAALFCCWRCSSDFEQNIHVCHCRVHPVAIPHALAGQTFIESPPWWQKTPQSSIHSCQWLSERNPACMWCPTRCWGGRRHQERACHRMRDLRRP